jgi:hypothetical protein
MSDMSPITYTDVTEAPRGNGWLLPLAWWFGLPVFTRTHVWATVVGFYWRGKMYPLMSADTSSGGAAP